MRKFFLLTALLCWVSSIAWSQTRQLSGQVTNAETGENLVGVSVTIKGSSKGTVTKNDGKFTLGTPTKGPITLVFSSTGFTTQQILLSSDAEIKVKLISESKMLDNVVVVGYGSVRKKDLTGAVGSIQSEDIVRSNPINATSALQGQVPGVVVTKTSNRPGQDFQIDIRGENTITGITEPLYVIDGVIGGRLRDINPSDIQSIDILKDASSTAIYGSRGANGVVIVTSKKGVIGKPKVTLDLFVGQKTPQHLPELQTAQQFYKMVVTDRVLNLATPEVFTANEMANITAGRTLNWVEKLTKPSINTGATIGVSGGNAGTTYRFSAGYLQQDGSIRYTTFKKYSLNGSVDSKINSFLKVGITGYLNYAENPTGSYEALRSAYRARPTGTIYYKDLVDPSSSPDLNQGPWNGYAVWSGINNNQVVNPLVESDPANYQFEIQTVNQMANTYAEFTILPGLTLKSSFSASLLDSRQGEYRGTYTKDRSANKLARGSYQTNDIYNYTLDNQLNYNVQKGKHKLNALFVQSAYKNVAETYAINFDQLPYASLWNNIGTAAVQSASSSYKRTTIESYMSRVNYTFNEKYLLTLTGRADGASQLAQANRWAFFPSGAFAWKLNDENFIQNLGWFSDLKLRVSYGEVGNANVSPYATQASILNSIYAYDQSIGNGFAPGNIGNKDLKWERSQELNLGLNMGFFNNRISAVVEVYKRNTKDLILQQTLPTSTGFSTVIANVGEVSNKGVEILLNTQNIITKKFSWTTSINFAKNINRIEKLANGVTAIIGSSLFVGQPVKSYYDYKFAGIWQISDSVTAKGYGLAPGSVRVVDQNNDGIISSSTGKDDRVVLGTQLPNYTMGMTNRFTYSNFDLSFMFYYRNGTLYKNALMDGTMADYTNTGYNHIVLDYWTRNNPINTWYGPGVNQPGYKSAIHYEDATFLRLTDITLGFNVPKAKLAKSQIDRLRMYFQITNPGLWTKFHGMDPEYNSNTYIDDVPTATYTFGLNIGF